MIAACPKCSARYRIDREKLAPQGVRLRCSKCQAVFRVRAPVAAEPSPARAVAVEPSPAPAPPVAVEQEVTPPVAVEPTAARPVAVEPRPAPPEDSGSGPVHAPPAAAAVAGPRSVAPPLPVRAPADPDAPLVLVGTPDAEVGKRLAEALEGWGARAVIVPDGVEAMLEIQRQEPCVVVLSPTLPRMYGFQVCEIVKRNESLKKIHVVLLGAIHHPDRYRRPPEELYGADAYVEEPDLPDALLPELQRLGVMPLRERPEGETAVATPPPEAVAAPRQADPVPTLESPSEADPSAPPRESEPELAPRPGPEEGPRLPSQMAEPGFADGSADELSDARAQAERLARIIVSDIVLYNEEKFAAAIEAGTVAAVMGPDLDEGRGLFRDRIDTRIRDEKDHLAEELMRVARSRGMQ
jgi:predicted Zn finger-like uncharacterized protein